ncbi:hypothetical protein [Clostridium thermarum]|uniref:hypothetical protein n=1 Tax=Clostridium thermarum TaxID=1716543 RepID=UPI0013D6B0FC|nr:hypothetical protein [Clostridium thermarum]
MVKKSKKTQYKTEESLSREFQDSSWEVNIDNEVIIDNEEWDYAEDTMPRINTEGL